MAAVTARRRLGPVTVGAVVVALLGALGVGCGGDDADVVAGEIRIVVHRLSGRIWTATGELVDDGVVCAAGTSIGATPLDLDGAELPMWDWGHRRTAAILADPPDMTVDYLLKAPFTCYDGSGTLTVLYEERDGGTWEVVGGTGAYGAISGGGTLEVERSWPEPLDELPPGGAPFQNVLDGTIRVEPLDVAPSSS